MYLHSYTNYKIRLHKELLKTSSTREHENNAKRMNNYNQIHL